MLKTAPATAIDPSTRTHVFAMWWRRSHCSPAPTASVGGENRITARGCHPIGITQVSALGVSVLNGAIGRNPDRVAVPVTWYVDDLLHGRRCSDRFIGEVDALPASSRTPLTTLPALASTTSVAPQRR